VSDIDVVPHNRTHHTAEEEAAEAVLRPVVALAAFNEAGLLVTAGGGAE